MGLISSAGVGSGLDVEAIIKALVGAERAPTELRLNRQESRTQTTLTGVGLLSSALGAIKAALGKMDSASDFKLRSATLSQSGYVSVSPGANASAAAFSVEVVSLAKGSVLESASVSGSGATFAAGTLSFGADGKNFSVTVEATDTLTQIRNKINSASSNFGVTATIVSTDAGTKLIYNSKVTGTGKDLVVTGSVAGLDALSTNTTSTQAASDGQIRINGSLVTNSTNTYTTAVADITITAQKANISGETTEVSITEDKSGVRKAVDEFVKAYNDAYLEIQKLTSNIPGATGVLAADGSSRSIMTRLRSSLSDSVSSVTGNFDSLAAVGITTARNGTLELNTTNFEKALSNDFGGVLSLFTADDGVSQRAIKFLDSQLGSNGALSARSTSLNEDLKRIYGQRESLNMRMSKMETRLRAQYGALDTLVAQMKGTSQFISQNLTNLNNGGSR